MNWIKLEDRYPEEEDVYMGYGSDDCDPKNWWIDCYFYDGHGFHPLENGDPVSWCTLSLTHWMPLPKPPEEE